MEDFLRGVLVLQAGATMTLPELHAVVASQPAFAEAKVGDVQAACARLGLWAAATGGSGGRVTARLYDVPYGGGAGSPADMLLADLVELARASGLPVRVHGVRELLLPVVMVYDGWLRRGDAAAVSALKTGPEVVGLVRMVLGARADAAFELALAADVLDGVGLPVPLREAPAGGGDAAQFAWLFVCVTWLRRPESRRGGRPTSWGSAHAVWSHAFAPPA